MLDKAIELYQYSISELLSPRLNVIITSVGNKGQVNAAPFSFVMPVSYEPIRIAFSGIRCKHFFIPGAHSHVAERQIPKNKVYASENVTTLKDTVRNIEENGEFGVNVLSIKHLSQMSNTALRYPYGVNELEMAGLHAYDSTIIQPPLVKEAMTAIECKVVAQSNFGKGNQMWTLFVGEGVAVHVDSHIIGEKSLRLEKIKAILNGGKQSYGVCAKFSEDPYILYPKPNSATSKQLEPKK